MNTKEKLLEIFEKDKGIYFSGEEIAEKLSVSRAAVWKAVNSLRSDGYRIDAIQNKGYCLSESTDILSAQGIRKYLEPLCSGIKLDVLAVTESTNSDLRKQASAGAPEGSCIIAGSQTKGKGRVGRSFYSPCDTGIYMSLLLRPEHCAAQQAVKLTTMAAVAVCEAIEKVSGEAALIKWVNDIYMNGKKVCGILTEASFSLESRMLDYAVLGVGINAYLPDGGFPGELEKIAGAVFKQPQSDGKNMLAAEFLNSFMRIYRQTDEGEYVRQYRTRSFLIGKGVGVLLPEGTRRARVLDVDENCHLVVEYDNGETAQLSSGEVSLDISGLRNSGEL
ncbi:MAG: biotin--[acetyl-CoA-carboxylase] ligase [Clostridiales bacterium]|nr:biotin--[acetyl-CoA-carboxylase] ligase [Clostridiales bacterium]